ncbi:MAG: domain S-box protein [Ramlibacter sp.]|nr:domain S-box protein [Ramlibacter sp.]
MTQTDHLLENECPSTGCQCSEAAQRFADIFDRLADGFFTLDAQWRFTYLNPAARKAFRAGDDLLAQPIWAVFPDARATIFEEEFHRAMETGATAEFEAFYPGLDIWLRVNAFPFDQGLAVSFADITEARQTQQQLADLTRELQDRTRAQHEIESFAHTVAHDLRSPLMAIVGFSQAMSEAAVNELGPRSAHYLRRIRSAAHQMDEMTAAILTLCRLDSAEAKRSLVDLSPIALECIANLREAEPGRQVTVSVAPCMWADCNPPLMKLALHNLLSNAWKYTGREGEPAIEMGIELGPEKEIRYFVKDNGIGFAPAEAQGVFEPFQRLHGDSFAGEGIGLATVKRIVDKHGGALWAVSQPGLGSTFYFTLP